MLIELVGNAIRNYGYSIPEEQRPFQQDLYLSQILWDRYLFEIREYLVSVNRKPDECFDFSTKEGGWSNQAKTVNFTIHLAEHSSPEVEQYLIKSAVLIITKKQKV